MADKVDLSLTGQADPSDKNYYLIPIKGLVLGQQYIGKLQWSFEDSALNNIVKNIWSNGFAIDTNVLTAIAKPKLISTNVKRYQGRIEITWSGTDYTNVAYDAKAFKRINVYVRDNSTSPANFVGMGFIDQIGGTFSFPASPSSYTIRITAVSATGLESTWSDEFTVSAITDAPSVPSGLTAAWSGTTFTVSFTHGTTSPANAYLKEYIINLIPPLPTLPKAFPLTPTSGSNQKFSLSLEQNQSAFGDAQQQFTGTVTAVDIYNNRSAAIPFTGPAVVTELPVPVITASETVNGYSVNYTTPASNTFDKIHIEEVVSDAATAPGSGYQEKINGSSNPILYPAGTGKRWVRARFSDKLRLYTAYSNIVSVTPIDIVAAAVDALAPDQIQSATAVGAADPSDSGGTLGIITLSIVNASATVPSDFNGYIVKVIRSSDSKEWTQQFNSKTYLSSIPVNLGISVGQIYTLSVATTDGRNQSNFVSVTGNPISVADTRSNTTVPTSLSLSATDSILTVGWTPVNDIKVTSYRVQLTSNADTAFASPIQEVYANSNVVSFGGLTASTTYRVRVTSKFGGPAGSLSTSHLSGTLTLNASGAISDGNVPTKNPGTGAEPAPVVKPLFKAFALTWVDIDNPDQVTYEVYVKTVNSTNIVDPANLVMEINGTFAVINSLKDGTAIAYPAETSPTTATDYYFAVRAKDADGISSAAVTPVGPFTASRTGRFDIAADSIYANHIRSGEITADKMTTDLLFVDKTINVGESTSANRIRLESSITTPVTMNDYPSGTFPVKSRIYIGAGNYYSSGTSFYTDDTGRFSLGDKLRFDGTDLTVTGSGTFTGLLTTGTGSSIIKVGTGANGLNNGIYIGATTDYIYTDGTFQLGGVNGISYIGGTLTVKGQLEVKGNSTLTGDLKLVSPGIFYIGDNKSTGPRIILNSGGIAGYAAAVGAAGTKVFGLDTSGFLEVKSANINGWVIDATGYANQIRKTSGTNTIKLDASTATLEADGAGYTTGIGVPDPSIDVKLAGLVLWAGATKLDAPFKVFKDGTVKATQLEITGYATTLQLGTKIGASDVNTNVTSISGGVITSGIIKSGSFPGTYVSPEVPQSANGAGYSKAGTAFDLVNGTITSRKFRIDTDGNAFFAGSLQAGTIITTPQLDGGTITGASINIGPTGTTPAYNFSVDSNGALFANSATISGNITANALTINASNYINSSGAFSLGGGIMTYSGGDINIGTNFKFSPDTRVISDDNEYAHTSSVTVNTNGELTRGRAFYYGSTTIPGASNTSRSIYNRATNSYTTISFVAGDIWMTVD